MTVYKGSRSDDDGMALGEGGGGEVIEENIILSDYNTSDELHALFERLGFEKKENIDGGEEYETEEMKMMAQRERKLKDQRMRDEEAIRRKKREMNNRRAQMMMKKQEQKMNDDQGEEDDMVAMKAEVKRQHYENDMEIQKLDKMIEESKMIEKKLHELIKDSEDGKNRDGDDEQVINLRKQVQKTRGLISRKRSLEAESERLKQEYINRLKEQMDGARADEL